MQLSRRLDRIASPPASACPVPGASRPPARPCLPSQPRAPSLATPRSPPSPARYLLQQERGQTCSPPAALDPPPRLPAPAAPLGLREPRMRGHRRPAAPGLRAVTLAGEAGRKEGSKRPFQRSLRGQRRSGRLRRTLTRGAGAQPCPATAGALTARLRSPAGRRRASSGRGAGQRPKPVSRTSV